MKFDKTSLVFKYLRKDASHATVAAAHLWWPTRSPTQMFWLDPSLFVLTFREPTTLELTLYMSWGEATRHRWNTLGRATGKPDRKSRVTPDFKIKQDVTRTRTKQSRHWTLSCWEGGRRSGLERESWRRWWTASQCSGSEHFITKASDNCGN